MARTIRASACPATSGSDLRRLTRAALLASTLLAGLPGLAVAQSLPTGGTVISGDVSVNRPGANSMVIRQGSDRAVVNWQGFSIGSGASVDIRQPGSSSAILNRVTGATTSQIHGALTANGQVYLVNPNGILIGRGGTVSTGGGFVASTLDVSDKDFNAGRLTFKGKGRSAGVTNLGAISVGRGGYAALIGGRVDNAGTITAPLGRIGLGAGERVTLDLSGDGFLMVALPSEDDGDDSALVRNSGRLSADGGRIEMKAATARNAARNAINLSGVAEARSVSMRNGTIVLGGGTGGSVRVSGRVSTAAPPQRAANPARGSSGRAPRQSGGQIEMTGAQIMLLGALLDVRGDGGGGRVRVGGDFGGKGTLPHAQSVSADADTRILADALTAGDGGRIVLWSDRRTGFDGFMSARGAGAGKGGFAEVSSPGQVSYAGRADLRAPGGKWGSLLIDPTNIRISYDEGATMTPAEVEEALALGDLILDTSTPPGSDDAGDILISAELNWTAATRLVLRADHNIAITGTDSIPAGITADNGSLDLGAAGDILIDSADIRVNGLIMDANRIAIEDSNVTELGGSGSVTADQFRMTDSIWIQNGPVLSPFAVRDFGFDAGSARFLRARGGTGTTANPYLLTDVYGLQGMKSAVSVEDTPMLGRHFALINDIDASGTQNWNFTEGGPEGFDPIGNPETPFTGSLDGRGHSIAGLFTGQNRVFGGLFGNTDGATISNLSLTGLNINANNIAGGLAAIAEDTVLRNVRTTGSVTATAGNYFLVAGGIVGLMDGGSITNASTAASVRVNIPGQSEAAVFTGGLAGSVTAGGRISRAYATGDVTVASDDAGRIEGAIGGFVGALSGSVTDAFSSGTVSFSQSAFGAPANILSIGGFAGAHTIFEDDATMTRTAARGAVTVNAANLDVYVGGHTGRNINGDLIDSYATGPVRVTSTGVQTVGGLIGYTEGGAIRNTYASGRVTGSAGGSNLIGGLIGLNMPSSGGAPTTTVTGSFFDLNRTGQAQRGAIPAYGRGISTATFRNTAAFMALAGPQGWDFATVWAPGGSGANPGIYTIDRVVFARPNAVTLQYGQTGTARTTGTIFGGPSAYVFAPAGDSLATAPVFSRLTFPSRNVGTGQFGLATTSLTSARGQTYRVVDLPASYRITPAPLTIRVNDQRKSLGQRFAFDGNEFTTSRLFFGDRVAGLDLASIGADGGAGVGRYAITGTGASGTGLSNYDISFVAGTMTVAAGAPQVSDSLPRPTTYPGLELPNPEDTITFGSSPETAPGTTLETTTPAGASVSQVILAARNSAGETLAQVDQFSSVLEIAAASCSQSDTDVSRYLACLSDALDDFANKLDEISTDLPPGMENVAQIVRDARRNIDNARARAERRLAGASTAAERETIRRDAINEARGAIASASTEIRKAIALARADDPELAGIQAATITRVADAVDSVGIELSRAVGL